MRIPWQLLLILELGAWNLELSSAPLQPALPYPPDLATNVPANVDLTWTPGDTELVNNGGFETGTFAGWTRVNQSPFGAPTNNTYINNGTYMPQSSDGPYPPYAGAYSAVTDQNGPGLISIYQDVVVPGSVNSVWLTWADRIHNYLGEFIPEPPNPQVYRVEVRNTANTVLGVAYRTEQDHPARTGWTKRSFDLTPYKGRTVRLAFLQEQWRQLFNMYWDNISLRVRDTGPASYDVFFGTNAVPGTNEFRGAVAVGSWPLPQLLPQTTYFWRVNARFGTNLFQGPVWRFATAPAGPLEHFTWDHVPSPQSPGAPFNISFSARDAADNLLSNFTGSVMVNACTVQDLSTNRLQDESMPSAFATHENSTVGYSFTPNADLLVLGFQPYAAGKVSLWTDAGILLGNPPLHLFAGRTYRIGVYSLGLATNYLRFDGLSTFAHGVLHQAYEGAGDAFPTQPHPARWWLLDLIYAVPTLSSPITSMVQLDGGSWNGSITIPSPGLVLLKASDQDGRMGFANLFTVAEGLRLHAITTASGQLLLRFSTVAGANYLLETSSTLGSWSPVEPAIPGTGSAVERSISPALPAAFFRVQRLP